MAASIQRIEDAFAHRAPDRTPLFEIYSPFHPIYWDIRKDLGEEFFEE